MSSNSYREEKHYMRNNVVLGQGTQEAVKSAVMHNNAVGTLMGYYDEALTILSVSDYLLYNLGYSYEEFEEFTKSSLKNIICGENTSWAEPERFRRIYGAGEGQMIASDGTPVEVRLYKEDSTDSKGEAIWVLAVGVDWEHENLALVNEAIQSGPWYMECDRNGVITEVCWSHAFRRMLGYHDILDFPNILASWSGLLHPDDRQETLESLRAAITDRTNQRKFAVDYRVRMRDGSYQWHRTVAEITRRRDGSARRVAGVFINVDKEKKDQMQIQKSNVFHQAFTKSNLCEYYVNLQENTFESLKSESPVFAVLEQCHTWDGMIETFIEQYVCRSYKQSVRQFYDRNQIAKRICETDNVMALDCEIVVDGKKRWIHNEIMCGESDRNLYAMVFLRDATDARNEEEKRRQLLEDNEALEHLVHSMTCVVDHFAICDLEHDAFSYHRIKIDSHYPTEGRYTNFVRMVADKFKTLETQESLVKVMMPQNLRANLKQQDDVYKFEYCDHEEKIFRMASFIPLAWNGDELAKVLWISMDITQEKKTEIESRRALLDAFSAAERANKAKTAFLSNMSHDIRTPMNAIVGLTAIAGANIDNQERVVDCLGKITKSSRHLLALINEVLDMARIESGTISLAEEDFSISELVDSLVILAKPGIEEHHHELDINIMNIEHEEVYGDNLRIQQVFTNLMSNAIKYTPDGGHITFSIREKHNGTAGYGCYEFSIEDNGIGMTPEFQKIMFQPFTRADDNRTTKVQGTGLGMAIAQNIVNMMNGSIKVESEPDKGTKFTVTIYLKLQEKEPGKIEELMDLLVLVVDDDEACCEGTVETLKEIGIAGEWVLSGEEAIRRTKERHDREDDYFAVIVDWKMPGMDGIETTRQIRRQVGKDVTIIILTSYDYSEIEEAAKEAGVDAFISKPLFRSRLTATFRQLVTGKTETSARNYLDRMSATDYSGRRILLVEDNDLNREIAAEIIGMTKASVDTAENGEEALDKIAGAQPGTYDMVLMDIQMPIMNGYEATAAIRALGDERSEVPIIAMTANAFAEDVQMAKNKGMNGHIAKPLDLEKLYEVLGKWLHES